MTRRDKAHTEKHAHVHRIGGEEKMYVFPTACHLLPHTGPEPRVRETLWWILRGVLQDGEEVAFCALGFFSGVMECF